MKHKTTIFLAVFGLFFTPALAMASTPVSGTLLSDTTWTAADSPYIIDAFGLTVPAGITLTIQSGVVVKAPQSNTPITVDGTLNVQGLASFPAYLTSLNDTAVGGGTGFSPFGYSWQGIVVHPGAVVHLDHAVIRNAGAGISNNGGTVTVSNSTFENDTTGILHSAGTTSIAGSMFQNNQTALSSSGTGTASFSNNTFSDNAILAYLDLSTGLVFSNSGNTATGVGRKGIFLSGTGDNIANQTLSGDAIPYVLTTFGVNIPTGKTFIVEPGAIIKFEQYNAQLAVNGTLQMNGTTANPIYVTSFADDSLGGDTDGMTDPLPFSQSWGSIAVQPGATAHFDHAVLRQGGTLINNGGTLAVSNSEISRSNSNGITHSAGTTSIASSTFQNNQTALFSSGIGTLSFTNNTFLDNAILAYFDITSGFVFSNSGNIASGVGRKGIFLSGNGDNISNQTLSGDTIPYIINVFGLTIPAGKTLTVNPGAIVKFEQYNTPLTMNGTLDVQGTTANPIYFTSFADDTLGGDSDGTDNPPYYYENWGSVAINSGATANFTHAILKRGGTLSNNGGTLAVSHSEITGSNGYGILHTGGTTTVSQSSIHDNASYGIYNNTTTALNAENNYWGSPTGPRHVSNPAGTGERVTDYIDFVPFLTAEPTTTPVTLALSYPTETEDDGNQDAKGVADKTNFTFSVMADGTPDAVNLIVGSPNGTSTLHATRSTLNVYTATSTFPKGHYTYHFEATSGGQTIQTPNQHFTTGYSNVAFLPGLEASRLYMQGTFLENQLWEPNRNDDVRKLYLNSDGTSVNTGIYTRDILDEKNVSPVGQGNIYKSFVENMNTLKDTHVINGWEPLPYDWRFDVRDIVDHPIALATTSYSMTEEIQKLAEGSDTGKVTIVGHSNGGLVAKVLANKLGANGPKLLDQMIFVASPQAGTPQAVGVVLHGFDQGLPFDSFPIILSPETARNLAVNMPSAYNLLPSESYFGSVHDPVISFDNDPLLAPWRAKYGIEINSAQALHNFLADTTRETMPVTDETKNPIIGNETLLNSAENLHNNTLDNWTPPPGVTLTQIAGWGEETLKSIVYYQGIKTTCAVPGVFFTCTSSPALEYAMKTVLDGDGTVVVPSALWTGGTGRYWVNLKTYGESGFRGSTINRKHADILEVPTLLDFIKNIFIRNGNTLPTYISAVTPVNTDTSTQLHFTLHSPLTLDLYDNLGNHTGISTTTGALEENIPGTRYLTFGEVKYISAPASTTLRLTMHGYATGSFTLDMEEVLGDTTTASTTFAGIPSATSTVVTITIPQGGNIPDMSPLSVDENGDGSADLTLLPKLNGIVTLPKPTLTVTADNKTVVLGSPIPSLTATLSPTPNDVTGAPNCTTTATASSSVGTYPVTCTIGTLTSNTYDFAFATGTLTVLYRFDGFLQPINDIAYHPTQSPSVFKGGSTVPVKFQIKKSDGTPVQSITASIFSFQKGNAMSASVDESTYSDPATSGSLFRWDSPAQQYIYNWSTKGVASGFWYKLSAKLDDGKTYSVVVGLR